MLNDDGVTRAQPLIGDDPALIKAPASIADDAATEPQKSDSPLRWAVLCLSCFALLGNYYCFDNPSAMKTSLDEYVGLTEQQFSLLYTVYSIPNVILPFFGEKSDKLLLEQTTVTLASR
jgi:hypothetical protein